MYAKVKFNLEKSQRYSDRANRLVVIKRQRIFSLKLFSY